LVYVSSKINPKRVVSFYLRREFQPFWDKLKVLAQREGVPISQLLGEMIKRYVEAHDPGQSQTVLPAFDNGRPERRVLIRHKIRMEFLGRYQLYGVAPKWREIVERVKQEMPELSGRQRLREAKAIVTLLKEKGLRVEES